MYKETINKSSKILIVDDTEINRELLIDIIENIGHNPVAVKSGENALELLKSETFDLILLDIMMPQMNGIELCKRLKKNEKTKEIPVVYITARTELETIIKGFEAGAVDYITKPIKKDEIAARINTHLELKNAKEKLKHELELRKKAETILQAANERLETRVEIRTKSLKTALDKIKKLNDKLEEKVEKRTIALKNEIAEREKIERKMLNIIIETEEIERRRFAKDLHDGLGPLLSTAKLYIRALNITTDQEKKDYTIIKACEMIDESIVSIKEISYNLSPHLLSNFGLNAALKSFSQKIQKTGNDLNIIINSNFNTDRFEQNIEITLFRVLVELIHNTLKHSSAKNIEITINRQEDNLKIKYTDDGIGFNVEEAFDHDKGMGLTNIISRIKSLNGQVEFESSKNKGINVDICIKSKVLKKQIKIDN